MYGGAGAQRGAGTAAQLGDREEMDRHLDARCIQNELGVVKNNTMPHLVKSFATPVAAVVSWVDLMLETMAFLAH